MAPGVAEEEAFQAEVHLVTGKTLKLTSDQTTSIEERIQDFETKTSCELLIVVTDASDPYPAASYRFGFFASFLSSALVSFYIEFHNQAMWPLLFFGGFLFFTWIGRFGWAKKIALSPLETERECKEKAIEFFHTLGTQETSHKVTAMIMISLFERKIEILVDKKISEKITATDLNQLVEIVSSNFRNKDFYYGLLESINSLEDKILTKFEGKVIENPPKNLSNTIHFKNL